MNWFIDMELSRIHREEMLRGAEQVVALHAWDAGNDRRPLLTLQGLKLKMAKRRAASEARRASLAS